MNILRNIFAVILGYATFVVSAVLLFKFSGINPHANPSLGVAVLTIVYGLVFSFIGGFLAQWISRPHRLTLNSVLAVLMAGFATFSLFKSGGNHYSQLSAIFLFAPISILGGLTYLRRIRSK